MAGLPVNATTITLELSETSPCNRMRLTQTHQKSVIWAWPVTVQTSVASIFNYSLQLFSTASKRGGFFLRATTIRRNTVLVNLEIISSLSSLRTQV